MKRRQHGRDLLSTVTTTLRSRPGRMVAMVLPVMIGVAMVIASFGIVASAEADFNRALRRLGANQLLVVPREQEAGGQAAKLPAEAKARALLLPTVRAVGALSEQRGRNVLPSTVADPLAVASASAVVFATESDLEDAVSSTLRSGRFLNRFDVDTAAAVVVLGSDIARSFAIGGDGLRSVLIDGKPHGVVGVLDPVTTLPQLDRSVLVPGSTAARDWGDDGRPSLLVVRVDDGTAQASAGALPRLVNYGDGPAPSVQVASDLVKAREAIGETFGILVAASGGLALLLGTIGIAFAMTAAILQRTSEIGLRRALGASRREIALQFLLEAAVVGVVGGALGAILGAAIVLGVASHRDWPVVTDPVLLFASFLLAVELAVSAGLLPAQSAARLDPMAALRT